MRNLTVFMLMGALCAVSVKATTINLGTAENFAVLAGSTVTNTGPTEITGDLGVFAVNGANAATGFLIAPLNTYSGPGSPLPYGPGLVNGTIRLGDTVAQQAQTDLTTAYLAAVAMSCTVDYGGGLQDLTLVGPLNPGVYCAGSMGLSGALTLDALGDPNAFFLFKTESTLITSPGSSVVLTGGGVGDNVFWQVGSSATLDTTTEFAGNILALASITLKTGANIRCGRALARNGAVTLDSNIISIESDSCKSDDDSVPAPEIGTLHLLSFSLGCCGLAFLRSKRQ